MKENIKVEKMRNELIKRMCGERQLCNERS